MDGVSYLLVAKMSRVFNQTNIKIPNTRRRPSVTNYTTYVMVNTVISIMTPLPQLGHTIVSKFHLAWAMLFTNNFYSDFGD